MADDSRISSLTLADLTPPERKTLARVSVSLLAEADQPPALGSVRREFQKAQAQGQDAPKIWAVALRGWRKMRPDVAPPTWEDVAPPSPNAA